MSTPDHVLIELNTADRTIASDTYTCSAKDPHRGGQVVRDNFRSESAGSKTPSREPRFYKVSKYGPSASLLIDNVNVIIYPMEHAHQTFRSLEGSQEAESSRGRVVDHIAFSVPDLAADA